MERLDRNFTIRISEVDNLVNTMLTKKSKDYEYNDTEYEEEQSDENTAAPPPLPIGPASEELNNYRPTQRKEDFDKSKTNEHELKINSEEEGKLDLENKENFVDQPQKRSLNSAIQYKGMGQNEAEEDYGDISVVMEPKIKNRKLNKNFDEKILESEKKVPTEDHITNNALRSSKNFLTGLDETDSRKQTNEIALNAVLRETLVKNSLEEKKKSVQMSRNDNQESNEVFAIHLVGDTTKYKQAKEKHYDANNRMYHPKGHIKDWKIDSTVSLSEQNFNLEQGRLRVKKSGLFFVYAQIYYSTKEDTSGFNILLNENITMRCITTGVSTEQMTGTHTTAPNSCFSAKLMRIQQNDTLSIKETQGERFTIFEPSRSFFGMYRLG